MLKAIINFLFPRSKPQAEQMHRKPSRMPPNPSNNVYEFLQLTFISSRLERLDGQWVRTEYRKDPTSGLTWRRRFPIPSVKGV